MAKSEKVELERDFDPTIVSWAKTRAEPTHSARAIVRFCEYVGKTPIELLTLQKNANGKSDDAKRFAVVGLVQNFVRDLKGRRAYKVGYYSTIKSWFASNWRALPRDYDRKFVGELRDDSDRPETPLVISLDILRDTLTRLRGDPRRRSMIAVQYETFSGVHELIDISNNLAYEIGEKIKRGDNIIELHMRWSRKNHNKSWHTFIGNLGCAALREYFETARGYPKQNEPIWFGNHGSVKALTRKAYSEIWTRLMIGLGFRPDSPRRRGVGSEGCWTRYGLGAHQLRRLAISQAQLATGKSLKQGGSTFDPRSAEYFSGHNVDPLNYQRLHDINAQYRLEQYAIVNEFLNPFATKRDFKDSEEYATLRSELDAMKNLYKQLQDEVAKMTAGQVQAQSPYEIASSANGFRPKVKDEIKHRLARRSK